MEKLRYRSVWISDIHLGTKGCKAAYLDNFLESMTCDKLYLVGDIIDGWVLARGASYFPQEHVNIIRRVLNKARKDTRVFYVVGNHDEFARKFLEYDIAWGNIQFGNEFIHERVNGESLLVVHGDLYDTVTRYHKWVSHLGDIGYNLLISTNRWFNQLRSWLGLGYWSLSAHIKNQVKQAVEFINSFEDALARECKERNLDGVICGHIHHAEMKEIDGVMYYNDGDWVESCTALVEHFDGRMEIVTWHNVGHEKKPKKPKKSKK